MMRMPDPPRVTALTPTRRDPARLTVKVDGRAVATLPGKTVDELGLAIHTPWTDDLAQRVDAAARTDKAMRQALNRLNRRAMTRRKLDQKLRDLAHDGPTRAAVLDRLEALGLLDDRAYAEALIRETQRAKPAGPMLLKKKLFERGVDGALADRLVAEATADPDQQRAAAAAFAQTKLKSMARLDTEVRKRRLYGALSRRGFTPDVVRDVMEQVASETNGG